MTSARIQNKNIVATLSLAPLSARIFNLINFLNLVRGHVSHKETWDPPRGPGL